MEDFPLLILFFIIYLIAGSAGRKKRKGAAARSGPMRARSQGEQRDSRANLKDVQTREGFQTAFTEKPAEAEQNCDLRRIHLHSVTNEELLDASEGEDPCHAGGVFDEPAQKEDDLSDVQQVPDIVNGVIMSEILMRPHERRALQRSRQRTNGY